MNDDKRNPTKPARQGASFPARLDRLAAAPSTARARSGPVPDAGMLRPQRLVREAREDQLRAVAPQGLGMDSQRVREAMVQRLHQAGLVDTRVAGAMARVPRHLFVDTALANQAYEDTSLPIGLGQTISKPSVVARMIELLCRPTATAPVQAPRPLRRVLEIGTGCGYQAAVLAQLAEQVVSIERLRPLHDKARENLQPLRLLHIRLIWGDGMLGHAASAPYDAIIAAAGGAQLPDAWLDQLAPGGRLVAPLERVAADGSIGQVLCVVDKLPDGSVQRTLHEAVLFVPLKSGSL
ncbi:MAG: protein-L-isoaspartate(D-aspartate) O-methyltransferase [Aquabacterium sp.]|nr:MAG: protein-L-isoaspartate(D-aspartate) O-methyltransferase [Aquabacterium sp.]